MIEFPYGVSDFHKIISDGYFYVDRTGFIRDIEAVGDYLLFLRPRRFGKSLLLSMLENYYDVAKADQFEELFGHLEIGQNPTPLHNQYFILKWDFSAVSPQGNARDVQQALHDHVNGCIEQFIARYRDWLDYEVFFDPNNALRSFQSLLTAIQHHHHRLYLLIDEYDNFANEVLTANKDRYDALLGGEGVLKTLFKAVKSATSGLGLDRMFVTGVSPVVMSDITSGFNIAKNIYLYPEFNTLCGFTDSEVAGVLSRVAGECGLAPGKADEALTTMHTFYNGYRFSYDAERLVYNSTLVLYFMEHLQRSCQYPRQMMDSNLAMDRAKICYISRLPGGEQLILDVLNEEEMVSVRILADRFGVEDMLTLAKDQTFMASLLYYFGVLTLGGYTATGELILKTPNLVVRKLYVERLRESLLPDPRDEGTGQEAARALYESGDMQPLCDFVEQRYFKVFDNRDYRWANELTVKTAFLTLLFNDVLYVMDSEPALERRYADLVMIVRPDMRQYQLLDILIEFKYVSLGEDVQMSGAEVRQLDRGTLLELPRVQEKLIEARDKLKEYQRALQAKYKDVLRLRTYAVVSVGFDRLAWVEVE